MIAGVVDQSVVGPDDPLGAPGTGVERVDVLHLVLEDPLQLRHVLRVVLELCRRCHGRDFDLAVFGLQVAFKCFVLADLCLEGLGSLLCVVPGDAQEDQGDDEPADDDRSERRAGDITK